MKITIVQGAFLPVPPVQGGAVEKAWYALGREFARQGHTVTHVGRRFEGLPDRERDAGVDYHRVSGFPAPASLLKLKWCDLRYSWNVRRALPEADVLVTNTFWLPMLERRKSRGAVYVHVARYPKGQLRHYPSRAFLQTVSAPIREAILREVPRRTEQVRVIPYPLAPHYLAPFPEQPGREILYTGRLHPEKGVHLLVEAFKRVSPSAPDWRLRLIGPWEFRQGGGGPAYRETLRNAAAGFPVDIDEPIFDEPRLVQAYQRAAIFAYPSLAEKGETFGLSVLEAMAAGCAPVVSSLACFGDFVAAGTNGDVFDHRSATAAENLAGVLGKLIESPATLAARRQAAWNTARGYSLAAVGKTFLDDFALVTRSKNLPP
ncbi:MAG TPA: glycosyltransferase family 4 protein [Opitutaceae bacterium]|nr:glycosyltransferase family 4 protein [Opitutaceae bacterium]